MVARHRWFDATDLFRRLLEIHHFNWRTKLDVATKLISTWTFCCITCSFLDKKLPTIYYRNDSAVARQYFTLLLHFCRGWPEGRYAGVPGVTFDTWSVYSGFSLPSPFAAGSCPCGACPCLCPSVSWFPGQFTGTGSMGEREECFSNCPADELFLFRWIEVPCRNYLKPLSSCKRMKG